MKDSLDGTVGWSDGLASAAKGSRGSRRSHPHVRPKSIPRIVIGATPSAAYRHGLKILPRLGKLYLYLFDN
jgi:hypothetical protein